MTKQNVIIADDHPLFRSGVKSALLLIDTITVVAECSDGMQAYQAVLSELPDIALLDIEMPILSGLDVAKKVMAEKHEVKVILLTMHKSKHFLLDAMQHGVSGYLLKDNATDELVECINAVNKGNTYVSKQLRHFLAEGLDANLHENAMLANALTPTEKIILKLISDGKTSAEIAELLFISINTVDNHRYNMTKELNLEGKNSLLKFAMGIKDKL